MTDIHQQIATALGRLPAHTFGPQTSMLRRALQDRGDCEQCWEWPGRIASNGYGLATLIGSRIQGTTAHRVVWEFLYGPIPPGLHVDHRCHDPNICTAGAGCPHRRCVNPLHLALATPDENNRRSGSPSAINKTKTQCIRGHPFSPDNTYIDRGKRGCRACRRARSAAKYTVQVAS